MSERLGRIFGPDTLELLADFVRGEVERTLAGRDHERRWLSVAGAADYLGMSEKAIRRRIERGAIAYTRHGTRILIDRRALDEALAARTKPPPGAVAGSKAGLTSPVLRKPKGEM